MKLGFYPKLAWEGIRKNKRLYTPYLLSCIGMVMMFYIMIFLSNSPMIQEIPGSVTLLSILSMGTWVVAFFSMLFLFYSSSFLMRRRKKEFGLYNILGMGKRNVSVILFWESVMIAVFSITVGTGAGIAFSKLFELLMANIISVQIRYEFTVSVAGITETIAVFGGIFFLILLRSLGQISLSNPVDLLRGSNVGEKPPKAKWLLAIAGVVMLAGAYGFSVTVDDPMKVLSGFFVAVLVVIAATYLLFVTGSIAMCRLLQKNKKYYYRANHFVSVSSMTFRMNRNGAGLASICILLTMVLVMLSSTTALLVGSEESLRGRYPGDINVSVDYDTYQDVQEDSVAMLRNEILAVLDEHHVHAQSARDYRMITGSGMLKDGVLNGDESALSLFNGNSSGDLVLAFFVSLADYNALMGESQTLQDDEVLIYPYRTDYIAQNFQIKGGSAYRVKSVVSDFVINGESAMTVFPTIFVIAGDPEQVVSPLKGLESPSGYPLIQYRWQYTFDLDAADQEQIEISQELQALESLQDGKVESLEANRQDFYSLYGGLFFLGIMLSIVFLAAAVLIIYYKQVSEGYEDQARFDIMQKVGMTKREIRKSINSQMMTVLFLPLLMAGVHLCFAFPMIRRMLLYFNLWNTQLLIATTAGCFLIFGFFYALVYRMTSNAYYAIVTGSKEGFACGV